MAKDFQEKFQSSFADVPEPLRNNLIRNGFYEINGLVLYARTGEVSEIFPFDRLKTYAAMLLELADFMERYPEKYL